MASNESLCRELPFNTICDAVLQLAIHSYLQSNENNFDNLEFNPFFIDNEKYNKDLEVNEFLVHNRFIGVPKSKYIFLDNLTQLSNKALTILNLNIRSIPKNLQLLKDTVMYNSSIKFDIIGLTEIRLDSSLCTLYEIPGYNMFTCSRNVHGGGIALYISTDYDSSAQSQFTISEPFIEAIGIETIIVNKKYLSMCIYRPPNGNLDNFLSEMADILSSIIDKKYHGMYIFGDFNVDLLKSYEKNVFDFINLMFSFSLFPLISKPTRVTSTSATLIDNIWTSQPEENISNYIIQTDISDHFPVISQCKIEYSTYKPQLIRKRLITETALDSFSNHLSAVEWNCVLNSICPDEAYNLFHIKFDKLFQVHFPIKNIRHNKKNEISPYITPALKNSIKEKNRLERLAKKWPLTYGELYKRYRNKLTTTLRLAKNTYFKNQLKANQGIPKRQWNSINSLLGRSRDLKSVIDLHPPCTDTATKFNEHFLRNILTVPEEETDFSKYLLNSPSFSMYLAPTNTSEVEKVITAIKSDSCGYDDISPKILKHTSSLLSAPLTHIINLTLKTGKFPDQLKLAKVIPLFKSGDRSDINNYRPISVLPAFSKIFEKIISVRLINYLEANNFLTEYQHGFRAQHSTESAILEFVNNVYASLEEKMYVVGVFLDLSKAFDTLDHKILLHKLEHSGIRGVPLKLFQSYLDCRKQAVYCNQNYSSLKSISKGVPQGSILGPILFLIYINDIVNASTKLRFVMYADDTTLLLKDNNIDSLHTNLLSELDNVKLWLRSNKLKLNISKTNYILFQNRSVKNHINPVLLDGEIIKKVNQTKFLGVYIDENLNWKFHIDQTCIKISKITGILYRIRHNLTTEAMISIYYTLCYPHLVYCVSIWACTWPSYLDRIVVAQNKFLRCIFFLKKFDSTAHIFTEASLMKFSFIHKYFTLLLIFKIQGHNAIFRVIENYKNTRSNNVNLVCPMFRTTLFKNSVISFGPELFNSLPQDKKVLLKTTSLYTYKKEIKSYLLSQQKEILS